MQLLTKDITIPLIHESNQSLVPASSTYNTLLQTNIALVVAIISILIGSY